MDIKAIYSDGTEKINEMKLKDKSNCRKEGVSDISKITFNLSLF